MSSAAERMEASGLRRLWATALASSTAEARLCASVSRSCWSRRVLSACATIQYRVTKRPMAHRKQAIQSCWRPRWIAALSGVGYL
ncbi:hypothetical protein FQZ97_1060160 [compost metagenome]